MMEALPEMWNAIIALRHERLALAVLDETMTNDECSPEDVTTATRDYEERRAATDAALVALQKAEIRKGTARRKEN